MCHIQWNVREDALQTTRKCGTTTRVRGGPSSHSAVFSLGGSEDGDTPSDEQFWDNVMGLV